MPISLISSPSRSSSIGMKKKVETFTFFKINNAAAFKKGLKSLAPKITTTTQLLQVSTQPITAVNIAFSSTGIRALGVNDTLGDPLFTAGQFHDAPNLGDPGTVNWVPAFKGTSIHGVFLLASDTPTSITSEFAIIQKLFGTSFTVLNTLNGQVRPGAEEGHERKSTSIFTIQKPLLTFFTDFGFMDGISQPGITGFTTNPVPGQTVIDPGNLLLGDFGDSITRPAWAKDGSFLAFRQLKQLVPEFNRFLTDNPIKEPGLTAQQGSALMGARMVGRWKSVSHHIYYTYQFASCLFTFDRQGAPVDLTPLFDDPVLGADPNRNNNFTFAHPGEDIKSNQTRCPFSAHIRKTAPRADFATVDTAHHIMRAGIPYGPEGKINILLCGKATEL